MVTRDEHYRKFGPLRDEATDLVILDYINELREEQGLPAITQQEFLDRAGVHLSQPEPYDWMKRE
jgi:hypothetical protein